MLDTVNKSEYLTISDIARLFRIENSKKTNVMKILLNLEETKNLDLELNFCNFYEVVTREKLQEALALRELPQTFMTVKEATQELKITERRVRLLISNGRLKNYAENLKREILLHPQAVFKIGKSIRSTLLSQQDSPKYPLPKQNFRDNNITKKQETEEKRKQREIEIAKIKAKDESYKTLEPMRFFYKA